jgi:hypothetical protein
VDKLMTHNWLLFKISVTMFSQLSISTKGVFI